MLIRYIWYINRSYCFCQVSSLRAFGNVHLSALQLLRGHYCKWVFMVSARGSRGSVSGAMLSSDHPGLLHHSPEVRSYHCLDLKRAILYIGVVVYFRQEGILDPRHCYIYFTRLCPSSHPSPPGKLPWLHTAWKDGNWATGRLTKVPTGTGGKLGMQTGD